MKHQQPLCFASAGSALEIYAVRVVSMGPNFSQVWVASIRSTFCCMSSKQCHLAGIACFKASAPVPVAIMLCQPPLISGKIEPADIAQGQVGDCWLMSALACLAAVEGAIQKTFVTKEVRAAAKSQGQCVGWGHARSCNAGTDHAGALPDSSLLHLPSPFNGCAVQCIRQVYSKAV